eukprot:scaffold96265_cov19-Prasinocladus_malaysianus.AAC.2
MLWTQVVVVDQHPVMRDRNGRRLHTSTRPRYHFRCDRWLAKGMGDGKTMVELRMSRPAIRPTSSPRASSGGGATSPSRCCQYFSCAICWTAHSSVVKRLLPTFKLMYSSITVSLMLASRSPQATTSKCDDVYGIQTSAYDVDFRHFWRGDNSQLVHEVGHHVGVLWFAVKMHRMSKHFVVETSDTPCSKSDITNFLLVSCHKKGQVGLNRIFLLGDSHTWAQ